jgi:hypothetical protein
MTDTNRRIMVAVHGWWGSGKTWFAHTAPGPRLVLDMEGGSEDVQTHQLFWDPLTNTLTTPSGSESGWAEVTDDTSVIVDIQKAATVQHVLTYLEEGDHPFNSVVFDSLTETQKQLKQAVASPDDEYDPNAVFDMQAWGRLLNHGELVVRRLRDLTRKHAARRVNVVVVMGSDTEAIPVRPLLQGALRKSLAGFFDLEGYLYTAVNKETGEEARIMQISPSSEAEAKCRLHLLKVKHGTHIINPDMREMLAVVNGGSTAETSNS